MCVSRWDNLPSFFEHFLCERLKWLLFSFLTGNKHWHSKLTWNSHLSIPLCCLALCLLHLSRNQPQTKLLSLDAKTTSSTTAALSSEHCIPNPCQAAAWGAARLPLPAGAWPGSAQQSPQWATSSPAKLKMLCSSIHIHAFLSRSVTKTEEIQANGPGNQNNSYLQQATPTAANMGGGKSSIKEC